MDYRSKTRRIKNGVLEIFGNLAGALQERLGIKPKIICSSRGALAEWKYVLSETSNSQRGNILIAAIRNKRWVEWAVYSACFLSRMGYQPILIFSSGEIARVYSTPADRFFGFWLSAQRLPFKFIDLDDYLPCDTSLSTPYEALYADLAQKDSHMMAAYDLRIEEFEPGPNDLDKYQALVSSIQAFIQKYAIAFDRCLCEQSISRMICPSGLIGMSVALRLVAQRKGLTTVFVEGWDMRPGHNIWSLNRPALDPDIDGWLQALGKWTESMEVEMSEFMAFREGEKPCSAVVANDWLGNFHQVQSTHKNDPLPQDLKQFLKRDGPKYLLGTNVVGDSATLGRATIFRSQQAWIREVIRFFKEHPTINLIIRTHPDETWKHAYQSLGEIAENIAKEVPNIFVIKSSDKVNTFSLFDHIQVGLAWVSNFGLDFALRGKPVILAARAAYASLGLCYVPQAEKDYFDLLLHLGEKPAMPEGTDINKGKAYHYVLFKKRSLLSDSPRYSARDYRLQDATLETKVFYRILAGELPDKGDYSPYLVQ